VLLNKQEQPVLIIIIPATHPAQTACAIIYQATTLCDLSQHLFRIPPIMLQRSIPRSLLQPLGVSASPQPQRLTPTPKPITQTRTQSRRLQGTTAVDNRIVTTSSQARPRGRLQYIVFQLPILASDLYKFHIMSQEKNFTERTVLLTTWLA